MTVAQFTFAHVCSEPSTETLGAKLNDVAVKLKINSPEDWYAVETEAFKSAGGKHEARLATST